MQNRYGIPSKQILRVGDGSSESLRKIAWSAQWSRIEA